VRVVAFNGSPNEKGNTYAALKMVAAELEKENIAVEIIHVGNQTIREGVLPAAAALEHRTKSPLSLETRSTSGSRK